MPDPYSVFSNPDSYLEFLTIDNDRDFEGQHFDRKQVGNPKKQDFLRKPEHNKTLEHITETVSAFANLPDIGGLLVLGISSMGEMMNNRQPYLGCVDISSHPDQSADKVKKTQK